LIRYLTLERVIAWRILAATMLARTAPKLQRLPRSRLITVVCPLLDAIYSVSCALFASWKPWNAPSKYILNNNY